MPLHDWTRVPSGLFHHFHQSWSVTITNALNRGILPKGLSALVEQRAGSPEADVIAIQQRMQPPGNGAALATAEQPMTQIVRRTDRALFAQRANRVTIRHRLGRIVAVIEIVSPGNKDSRAAFRDFVEKTIEFLRLGVHLLIVDLFPPSPRDPFGIHKAIWDEIVEEDFHFPQGKDRILVSYETGSVRAAYVEPVAIGDRLPDMPLFLANASHVNVPLESTYQATWDVSPDAFREAVETGVLPDPDAE